MRKTPGGVRKVTNKLRCKECGSENLNKAGYLMQRRAGMCQRFHCKDCGHLFVLPVDDLNDTDGS